MSENEWFSIFIFSTGNLKKMKLYRERREIGFWGLSKEPTPSHCRPPLVVLELTVTELVLSGTAWRAMVFRESPSIPVKTILLFERRDLSYLEQCWSGGLSD